MVTRPCVKCITWLATRPHRFAVDITRYHRKFFSNIFFLALLICRTIFWYQASLALKIFKNLKLKFNRHFLLSLIMLCYCPFSLVNSTHSLALKPFRRSGITALLFSCCLLRIGEGGKALRAVTCCKNLQFIFLESYHMLAN